MFVLPLWIYFVQSLSWSSPAKHELSLANNVLPNVLEKAITPWRSATSSIGSTANVLYYPNPDQHCQTSLLSEKSKMLSTFSSFIMSVSYLQQLQRFTSIVSSFNQSFICFPNLRFHQSQIDPLIPRSVTSSPERLQVLREAWRQRDMGWMNVLAICFFHGLQGHSYLTNHLKHI